MVSIVCFSFFFFFQAEDGIRDYKVTGVQTCALPIFQACSTSAGSSAKRTAASGVTGVPAWIAAIRRGVSGSSADHAARRSEERRVGEEGRSRGAPYH